ncbi:MAG: CXXC-type zinc finger protein, partial [SAR324 cluster bacterium]|nr:CXXC-type zinc finger protein [SAR324 cluster bacterium]
EDDFLDDLLGNLGNKIASIIPKNVSSQNIPDIAEEGLNNEEIIADLMNMFTNDSTASADTTGDSRVNTPVTSPLPDLMEVAEPPQSSSDPVELVEVLPMEDGNESKGFDASLSITHVENNVMDMLGKVVNETINVVTEPFVKQISPAVPATSDQSQTTNRRKRKKPKTVPDQSKKSKNQEGGEGINLLSSFRRQFGDVVSSAKAETYPETENAATVKETVVENNMIAAITCMVKESNKVETKEKEESKGQVLMERERHISAEGIDIIADPADFEKNIVVEVLEEGLKIDEKSKRRERCNKCPGCRAPPCGQCPECKDKKANGGPGTLKKACRMKPCDNLRSRKMKPSAKLEQNIENIQPEGKSPPIHRGLSKMQPFHLRNQQTDSEQVKSGVPTEKIPAAGTKSGSLTTPNPYLIKPLLYPSVGPQMIPIPANLIPSPAVVQTLPPGFKSLGFSAMMSQPSSSDTNKENVAQTVSSSGQEETGEETDGQ